MGSRNRDTPIQILTQVLVVWPQGGLLYLLELVDSWSENWEQEPDFRRRQWQAAASSSWKRDLRSWTGSPYHWTTGVGSYVWVSSFCLLCQKQMQVRRSSEGKELSRKFIKKKIILQKDRRTQRERHTPLRSLNLLLGGSLPCICLLSANCIFLTPWLICLWTLPGYSHPSVKMDPLVGPVGATL